MTETPSPFTYRMDAELRRRLEDHARRHHRNLTQTLTALLIEALDNEVDNERMRRLRIDLGCEEPDRGSLSGKGYGPLRKEDADDIGQHLLRRMEDPQFDDGGEV